MQAILRIGRAQVPVRWERTVAVRSAEMAGVAPLALIEPPAVVSVLLCPFPTAGVRLSPP